MEEFRVITGSENYEVNNFGDIRNRKTGRILKGGINRYGYRRVMIKYFGVYKSVAFHRICAIEFIENPNNYPCVNHKDGDKINNRVDNLEWFTYKENNIHAFATNLKKGNVGVLCHYSKLTNSDVLKIRRMLSDGYKMPYISSIFSVHTRTIQHIKYGKTWKHI